MKIDEDQYSLTFEKGSPGSLFLKKGWEHPEIWGVKNSDTISEISFPKITVDPEGHISLNFWCCCRSTTHVLINGNCVTTWLPDNSFFERAVKIPNAENLTADKPNVIQFQTQTRKSLDLVSVWIQGGKFYKSPYPIQSQDIIDPFSITHAPVFITGIPRSGTSITYKIICDLLGVKNPSMIESFFFSWAFSGFQDSFAGDCANAWLGEYLSGKFNNYRLGNFPDPDFSDLLILARYYYQLGLVRYRSARIIDKTPENIFYWKAILAAFPEAKLIFCTRPALDVYASYKKRGQESDSKEPNADNKGWLSLDCEAFVRNYEEYLIAAKSLLIQKKSVLVVDYDRLTSREPLMLEQLSKFVGCEISLLNSILDKPIKAESKVKTALKGGRLSENRINVEKYLDKGEIALLRNTRDIFSEEEE